MSKQAEKPNQELRVFQEFATRSGLPIVPSSIENREPCEPDILCMFSDYSRTAFELKEICDEDIKEEVSLLRRGKRQEPRVIRGVSPHDLRCFLRRARAKTYKTDFPIELLLYTKEEIILTPDIIIPNIRQVFSAKPHCFTRIWFMGNQDEPCMCVFPYWESPS